MTYSIDSGQMNRRMTFQSRSTSKDTFGQQFTPWADVFTAWVQIEPLQGRELINAQAVNVETTHRVTLRYRAGVSSALRGVYQGRVFNVLNVIDPETAHIALQLLCSEGLNPG